MNELATFLKETVNSGLRAVATYDASTHEIIYLREDMVDRAAELDVDKLITEFKNAELDQTIENDVLTGHSVTLRVYADMLILHCFIDEYDAGTLISFDATIGSDFLEFAGTCAELAAELHTPSAKPQSN